MSTPAFNKEFAPRLVEGDLCMLWNGQDFVQASGGSGASGAPGAGVFECVALTGAVLWGQHGCMIVWSQAGAAPAGYALDANAIKGTVPVGGAAPQSVGPSPSLNYLKGGANSWEIIQARFLAKVFGSLPGSWAVSDMDVVLSNPTSDPLGRLKNTLAVINAIGAFPMPSDVELLPASGADGAQPTAYPALDFFETGTAVRSEQYILADASPSVTIYNNNPNVAMDTASLAVGLISAGYRMRLNPVACSRQAALMGSTVWVPGSLSDAEARKLPKLSVGSPF